MGFIELLTTQLGDVLRIGLLCGLFVTMLRTQAQSGVLLPLAIGAVFVAVILPLTSASALAASLPVVIGSGIVANAIWLAIIFASWTVYRRMKP